MADIGLSSGFLPKLQGDPNAREVKAQNFAQDIELLFGIGAKAVDVQGQKTEFGSMIAKLHIQDNIRMHRDMMTKYKELAIGRENDKEFWGAWQQDQKASLAMMVADADKYNDQPMAKEQYLNGVLDYASRENAQFMPEVEKQIFNIDKSNFGAEIDRYNTDAKMYNRATLDSLIVRGEMFGDPNARIKITGDGLKTTLNGLEANIAQITSGEGGNAFIQSVINPETGEIDDVALISKFNSSMPNDLILYKRNEDGTINANFNKIDGFDQEKEYAIKLYESMRGNILKTLKKQDEGTDVLAEAVNKVVSESQIVKSDDYTVIMQQYKDKDKALIDLYTTASPAQQVNIMEKILKFKIEKEITGDVLNQLYTAGGKIKLNKDFGIEDKNILIQLPNGKNQTISFNTTQSQEIIKEIITGQANKINVDLSNGDTKAFDRFEKIIPALDENQVNNLFPVIGNFKKELNSGIAKKSYTSSFSDVTKLINRNNIMLKLNEKNILSLSNADKDFMDITKKKFSDLIDGEEDIKKIDSKKINSFFNSVYTLDKQRKYANTINSNEEQKTIANVANAIGSMKITEFKGSTNVSNKTAIALATLASGKTKKDIKNLTEEDIAGLVQNETYNYSRMFGDNTTVIRPIYAHNGTNFDDIDMEMSMQRATKVFADNYLGSSSKWTVGDISYDSDMQGNLTLTATKDGIEYTQTFSVQDMNNWLRDKKNIKQDKKNSQVVKDSFKNIGLGGLFK